MQKYIKPNGTVIEVVDTEATRAFAKLHGWKKPAGRKPRVKNDYSGRSSREGT
jgi:hypothetical protein